MNTNVYIAVVILVCAVCTFSERLFPFLIFGKHKVPRVVRYLGKVLPAPKVIAIVLPCAIMAMLVVYCLRGTQFTSLAACAPQLIAAAVTVGLHLWKHSTLLSIAGGTACYMVLIRVIV